MVVFHLGCLPFWCHFPYFLHSFFGHRFCIDFVSNFHAFLSAQNHVFYCKTNSFEHFSLFQKSMNFHRFWYPFWHNFRRCLALIFNTFSTWNFACLFGYLFGDFWSKMVAKMSPKGARARKMVRFLGAQGPSKNDSRTQPRIFIDFGRHFNDMLRNLACFGASFFVIR